MVQEAGSQSWGNATRENGVNSRELQARFGWRGGGTGRSYKRTKPNRARGPKHVRSASRKNARGTFYPT